MPGVTDNNNKNKINNNNNNSASGLTHFIKRINPLRWIESVRV